MVTSFLPLPTLLTETIVTLLHRVLIGHHHESNTTVALWNVTLLGPSDEGYTMVLFRDVWKAEAL